MTFWLWVIGAIAVVWPIILFWVLDRHYSQTVGHEELKRLLQKLFQTTTDELNGITGIIEEQDKLIAVLWSKTYGYDGKHHSYTWNFYPKEVYSVKPKWSFVYVGERVGVQTNHELRRFEEYPWKRLR